jgi:hypothetical protein
VDKTTRGCLATVKQNMGPTEFKNFMKQNLAERNRHIMI